MRMTVLAACAATMFQAGTALAGNVNVLWYNGYNDGFATAENALATPGTGVPSTATWTITHWYNGQAKPAGTFDVLVVGSYSSYAKQSLLNNLPTFGDRIFVTGQDADYHLANTPGSTNFNGPRGFLRNAINWAASGTGMGVVELSPGEGAISLAELGITGISGDKGYTDKVVIPATVASFPVNANLTTAGLSNWGTSAHDAWTTISSAWTAINTDGGTGIISLVSTATAALDIAGVPEPASLALVGMGVLGLAAVRKRRGA